MFTSLFSDLRPMITSTGACITSAVGRMAFKRSGVPSCYQAIETTLLIKTVTKEGGNRDILAMS